MTSRLTVAIVGPMGHGKSTFGNKILNGNYFTSGASTGRVTKYVEIEQNNGYVAADCAGFGDTKDDKVFSSSYKLKKAELLRKAPLDAILFVVKFNNEDSVSFYDTTKEFWKYFGTNGLRSTIFVCIQCGTMRYSDKNFEEILKRHPAYRFFRTKCERDIPFVLWDNFTEYPGQQAKLETTIRDSTNKYTYDMLMEMYDKFDIFEL